MNGFKSLNNLKSEGTFQMVFLLSMVNMSYYSSLSNSVCHYYDYRGRNSILAMVTVGADYEILAA